MHSNRRRSNGSWQWKGAGLKKLSRGKGLQVCLLGDHLGNIPSKLFPVIKVQGSLTIHRTRWHFRHRFDVDVKVWSNGVNNMWLTFWLRLLYLGYFAITNEAFGSCMQLFMQMKSNVVITNWSDGQTGRFSPTVRATILWTIQARHFMFVSWLVYKWLVLCPVARRVVVNNHNVERYEWRKKKYHFSLREGEKKKAKKLHQSPVQHYEWKGNFRPKIIKAASGV